jgi:hypothetical protein
MSNSNSPPFFPPTFGIGLVGPNELRLALDGGGMPPDIDRPGRTLTGVEVDDAAAACGAGAAAAAADGGAAAGALTPFGAE